MVGGRKTKKIKQTCTQCFKTKQKGWERTEAQTPRQTSGEGNKTANTKENTHRGFQDKAGGTNEKVFQEEEEKRRESKKSKLKGGKIN